MITFLNLDKDEVKDAYRHLPQMTERLSTIKDWFEYLYNPAWKRKIDQWCYAGVISKLQESGVPYIVAYEWLEITYPIIPDRNTVSKKFKNYLYHRPNPDPGYHTTPEDQRAIADIILDHIKIHNFLDSK